jgi:histidinol-phosphate aminotransferase
LTVHTLSKSASLAGLRLGFAIGDAALVEGLCRVRDSFNSYTVDRLALAGGTAAVQDAAYYDAINRRVIATRERVTAVLRGLGFEVLPSSANFMFIRQGGIVGARFFAALRERGILSRHFKHERIANYVRVSIGTDMDMDVFLEACQGIIKSGS